MKRVEITEFTKWEVELVDCLADEPTLEIRVGTETYRIENPANGEAVNVETGERVLITVDDPFCLVS